MPAGFVDADEAPAAQVQAALVWPDFINRIPRQRE